MLYIKKILYTSRFNVFVFTLISFFIGISTLVSQSYSCENTGLKYDLERLETLIGKNIDQRSIVLADSLIEKYEKRRLTMCKEFLWALNYKANGHEMKQELSQSLFTYSSILPIALKNEYWELLAQTYISIARTHEVAQRTIDSKRNLEEAQLVIDDHNLDSLRARLCSRATSYYRIFTNNKDTAMILAKKAVSLGIKYNNKRARSDGYLQLGMLSSGAHERLKHFKDGLDLNIDDNTYHLAIMFNGSIAGIYVELDQLDLAEKAARKNLEYVKLLTEENEAEGFYNIYGPLIAHGVLSQVYEKRGIQDSVDYHNSKKDGLYEKMSVEQDQNEISQQEIKDAVGVERIKAETIFDQLQRTKYFAGVILLLLAVFGVLLYSNYRNRMIIEKKNILISDQITELSKLNEKQGILLSEVHHRVKNNLQNIISLIMMQETKVEDEELKRHFTDISSKIYSIALIHEQLYRDGEFEIICMNQYFTDLTNHYYILADKSLNVNFVFDVNDICLNIETVIPLGLICSELITNSIKYASASTNLNIYLQMAREDYSDQYKLVYSDNGVGYPENVTRGQHSGMGMTIIKGMARQIKADLVIKNQDGAMTELTFKQKEVSKI